MPNSTNAKSTHAESAAVGAVGVSALAPKLKRFPAEAGVEADVVAGVAVLSVLGAVAFAPNPPKRLPDAGAAGVELVGAAVAEAA
jgi:hypothetical protein